MSDVSEDYAFHMSDLIETSVAEVEHIDGWTCDYKRFSSYYTSMLTTADELYITDDLWEWQVWRKDCGKVVLLADGNCRSLRAARAAAKTVIASEIV
jgi:hypothetical protein